MRTALDLAKQTYREWSADKASTFAAALAYYAVFSIAPLLLIAIAIAGLFFGQQAAQGAITNALQQTVGPDVAQTVQGLVASAGRNRGGNYVGLALSIVATILGAMGIFGQLQSSLNFIWDVEPIPGRGFWGTLLNRLLPFLMVAGVGLLLVAFLLLSSGLAALNGVLQGVLPSGVSGPLLQFLNFVVAFAVITLLFAAIFKVLPDVEISWRDIWLGAAITALLFTLGEIALGYYFGLVNPGSAFGAAGSLVVLLVWIYYSAQIFFLGAEFTQVYANRSGRGVRPSEHAQWVTTAPRLQEVGRGRGEAGGRQGEREGRGERESGGGTDQRRKSA